MNLDLIENLISCRVLFIIIIDQLLQELFLLALSDIETDNENKDLLLSENFDSFTIEKIVNIADISSKEI